MRDAYIAAGRELCGGGAGMAELQRELLTILRTALDPRWWVLAVLMWATRDLVLAGKLSGDAWAVLLTLAGGVMGVGAVASVPVVRDVLKRLSKED